MSICTAGDRRGSLASTHEEFGFTDQPAVRLRPRTRSACRKDAKIHKKITDALVIGATSTPAECTLMPPTTRGSSVVVAACGVLARFRLG
jgi:hypothetical protein